ncbi:MAG TPA: hypothetical protein VGC57_16060 [Cellulomonas sp.]
MIRVLAVCVLVALALVVWVVVDPTPALDGTVLPPALVVAAVALVAASAAERRRRSGIVWHAAIDEGHPVRDLTAGRWPRACGARAEFRRDGSPVTYRVVCTRRTSHTGRHAAGHGGLVVAVWSGPRS